MKVKSLIAAVVAAVLIPLGVAAQCTPQSLPYTENFDGMSSLSSCFITHNASLSSSYSVTQGGKSVVLTTTSSDGAYIVFPALSANANAMECLFQIRGTATVNFYAGIVPDTSDISTFTPIY